MRRSTDEREVTDASFDSDAIDDAESSTRRRGRRTVLLTLAVVAVVALFTAGWAAAQTFESPAQRAASAKAPAAGSVTAPVVDGNLEQTVSATATVGRTDQENVPVNSSLASSVVTKNPAAAGRSVGAGAVVLEVNGRPVLALPGSFPFYRTITLGDHGPDVQQLQNGLSAAGFDVTDDGSFGAGTARAVTSLYARSGYSVPTVSVPSTSKGSSGKRSATGSKNAIADTAGGADVADTVEGGGDVGGDTTAARSSTEQVSVPAAEVMVFASLPADIVSTPRTGTVLGTDSAVAVESGQVVASAPVVAASAAAMKVGMTGTVTGPDGKQARVSVTSIDAADVSGADGAGAGTGSAANQSDQSDQSDQSGSDGAAGGSGGVTIGGRSAAPDQPADGDSLLRLSVETGAFPATWLHQSAVAVITVHVAAQHSLIVPSIAVISGADGVAHVLKRGRDGTFVSVPVKETGALEGKSAVQPSDEHSLRAGDLVKVG